jgi:hypothetical protein
MKPSHVVTIRLLDTDRLLIANALSCHFAMWGDIAQSTDSASGRRRAVGRMAECLRVLHMLQGMPGVAESPTDRGIREIIASISRDLPTAVDDDDERD